VEYGDLVLNIKSYKKPIFINRIAYSFFRKSKAKRAYEYAVRLTNSGFATPDSVAYMEYFNSRLLNNSYFVSIHNDEAKIFRDYQYQNLTEELTIMLQQMAEYIAKLHDNNIIHLDFSPGNILIEKVGDKYIFSLIDINRMGFKKVSTDEGMMNFGRLCVPDDKVAVIAKYYAKARNIDEDFCMQTMYKNNRKNIKKFTIGKNRKQKILAFFGKK
jgi:serine/threonine protein kinase